MNIEMKKNGSGLLYLAVQQGNKKAATTLLKTYQADPDIIRKDNGSTPLMIACFDGDMDLVKLLLQYGADIQLRNKQGKRCFEAAADAKEYKILGLLNSQPMK